MSLSAALWLGFLEIQANRIYQIFSDVLNNGPTLAERTTLEAHDSFGQVSTARSRLCLQPRASLITLSSDSPTPCVTEHLPQRCRVSSLAPSPHSTSAHCHWVKREGKKKKIHSTPAQCQRMSRAAEERCLSTEGGEGEPGITGSRTLTNAPVRNNKQMRMNK